MKKLFATAFAFLLISALAWAAGPMPDTLNVTFPFPVIVNNMTLPAGTYEFQRDTANTPVYFKIFNSQGKEMGMTGLSNRQEVGTASASDTVNRSEVVVDEVNGNYYLDTLYLQGMNKGFRFQQADELHSQLDKAHQLGHEQHIPITLQGR